MAGGVSQTPSYLSSKSETEVKAIFRKQLQVFIKKDVDFLIAEVNEFTDNKYCLSGDKVLLYNGNINALDHQNLLLSLRLLLMT